MKKLDSYKSHVALYAKNHYLRSENQFQDLRKIIATGTAMDLECVRDWDVFTIVFNLCFELTEAERMRGELLDIFKRAWLFPQRQMSLQTLTVDLLGLISIVPVLDADQNQILEIGIPDPEVLPLTNPAKYSMLG